MVNLGLADAYSTRFIIPKMSKTASSSICNPLKKQMEHLNGIDGQKGQLMNTIENY